MNAKWILGLALAVCTLGAGASYVTDAVAQMPAKNSADEAVLSAKILSGGAPAVKELCGLIAPAGADGKDDTAARYAVTALVRHAGRPGGESDRMTLSTAMAQAVGDATDAEVKAFLINRLQDFAKDEAVPALAGALGDEKVTGHAAMALEQIATPAATEALAKALPSAAGDRRVAIAKALGSLRAAAAADEIRKSATDADAAVRHTSLWALANIGDAQVAAPLDAAIKDAKSPYDKANLYAAKVLLLRRLAAGPSKDDAVRQLTEVASGADNSHPANVRIAAARVLADVQGEAAAANLLTLADKGDGAFRAAVLGAVAKIPGETVTAALAQRLSAAGATAEAKGDLLDALARRKDASAQGAVLALLKDADPFVRAAAARAAAAINPDAAIAPLLEIVTQGTDDATAKAAAAELGRMPGDKAVTAAAAALDAAPASAKVILLDLLAARSSEATKAAVMKQTSATASPGVRLAALRAMEKVAGEADVAPLVDIAATTKETAEETAALKAAVAGASKIADSEKRADAFLAAIAKAEGAKRATLERSVAKVGGKRALDVLVADLKSDDKTIREGGIRALAEWNDDAALAPLLDAATKADAPLTQQVIALRGAVQVLKNATKMPPADKAKAYSQAMSAAKRPDEKKLILGALSAERGQEAFDLAAAALNADSTGGGNSTGAAAQKGPSPEAALAVIKIALPAGKGDPGLKGPAVADALKKAIPACPDKNLKAEAQRYLTTLK